MSSLGLSGLASGMDTDAMIEKILKFESQKVTSQQIKKAQAEAKQQAWGQVRSSLNTLRSKLGTILLGSTFTARSATVSDATIASVTVTSGSTLTTHSLTVRQLAQYHVLATKNVDDPNAQLGQTGTLTFTVGETTVNVALTSEDTLNSLRDKVNEQVGANVKAEVVKVPEGTVMKYRLVLTAKTQGAAGQIDLGDINQQLLKDLGLSKETSLGSGVYEMNQLSAAQDADFTLNGVDYTSSSNVVSDLLPGLTVTLKKGAETNNTTSITVEQNADKTVAAVEDWVEAVNQTIDLLKEATKYDSTNKEVGLLNGDQLARSLLTNLRGMLSEQVVGLPDDLNRLSQAGITSGVFGTADFGKLVVDKTKLKEAILANEEGVAKLFGAIENNVALKSAGATTDGSSAGSGPLFAAADLINGDTDSDRFGSVGGGWESAAVPTSGAPQYAVINLASQQTIESVRLFQPDNDTYVAKETGLKDYTLQYWNAAKGDWADLKSVTNHSGPSAKVEFDPVTTTKIRIMITGTYGTDSPARLTEVQVNARNSGPTASMNRYLRTAFEATTGSLDVRDEALKAQIADYGKQIDKLNESLTKREQQLRLQFSAMEQTLAKLQSQSSFIQLMQQSLSSRSSSSSSQ